MVAAVVAIQADLVKQIGNGVNRGLHAQFGGSLRGKAGTRRTYTCARKVRLDRHQIWLLLVQNSRWPSIPADGRDKLAVANRLKRGKGEPNLSSRVKKTKEGRTSAFRLPYLSRVQCYHAGLRSIAKAQAERVFKSRKPVIIVATVAFGMGIDRDNVRFVVNFGPPSSINEYMQEVGRAARDGHDAECLLLHTKQDWMLWKIRMDSEEEHLRKKTEMYPPGFLKEKRKRLDQRRAHLDELHRLVHPKQKACLHQALAAHFEEVLGPCKESCDRCQGRLIHRANWRESTAILRASLQEAGREAIPDWETLPECDDSRIPEEPGPEDSQDIGPIDPVYDIELPELDYRTDFLDGTE